MPRVRYPEIADELNENAAALNFEVATLARVFSETNFFGDDQGHFRHAHFGLLMACMGQIDVMSLCENGLVEPEGGQTVRMLNFMGQYLDPQKIEEHRVAIQLLRHTLMHTGALRYLYRKSTETAYTWRLFSAEPLPAHVGHYTLSDETSNYQDDVISSVDGPVTTVMAFNVHLTQLAADVERVAGDYTTKLGQDPFLQATCEDVYPTIRVQRLRDLTDDGE